MENTEESKKYNIKLYPIYKMLSWDLLFYYSIIFLFLTQIKGIPAADVILAEALYPLFKFILLIPNSALISKCGKRKSLIIANLSNCFSILFYIIAQNFTLVVIGQFFSAMAYTIKGMAETNLLYDSLPKDENRSKKFARIDGQGTSSYYYIDAISSVASGFLYVINGYLPLILCLIFCGISTFISYRFKETATTYEDSIKLKTYMKDLRKSFKYMFQSSRLRYLMIFGAILSGFMGCLVSLRSATLEQIGISEEYFGIIFAVLGIISGITSRRQNVFHDKFKNKTLAVLAVPTSVSCMLIGLTIIANLPYNMTLTLILSMFLIQYIAKGPFYILIRKYLNNFTNTNLREKISSCYNLIESLLRTGIGLFVSFLLRETTVTNTVFIIGCILTIAFVLLLDKMRGKVGLKAEEYNKKEIEFTELK